MKFIKFVPSHVLEGLKFGTGLYMFTGDFYQLLHIHKGTRKMNIYEMITSIYSNFQIIEFKEITVSLIITALLLLLHFRRPKIPWFFFLGVIGAMYGLL